MQETHIDQLIRDRRFRQLAQRTDHPYLGYLKQWLKADLVRVFPICSDHCSPLTLVTMLNLLGFKPSFFLEKAPWLLIQSSKWTMLRVLIPKRNNAHCFWDCRPHQLFHVKDCVMYYWSLTTRISRDISRSCSTLSAFRIWKETLVCFFFFFFY